MSYDYAKEGLPTQPGEASVRSYHSGGGPVPEHSDGWLHPAVARQDLVLGARDISRFAVISSNTVSIEPVPDETYSGATFSGIAFGD